MYNITDIVLVFAGALCICNLYSTINDNINNNKYHFFYLRMKERIFKVVEFYNFICEYNPLYLDYSDSDSDSEKKVSWDIVEDLDESSGNTVSVKEEKYDDKYLEKFKSFSNDFYFYDFELEDERQEYAKIKLDYETSRLTALNSIQQELLKITEIQEKHDNNELLTFFDVVDDEEIDNVDYEDLYKQLIVTKDTLLKKLEDINKLTMTDDDMQLKARETIVNKKLDKFMDNYILEHTPLGNIYMRYNNDKKSFEYFSNSTMPYRYLEAVGRKYVMTYWCKSIFVDIQDELKKAEQKYDEDKEKKEEDDKMKSERKSTTKQVMVQLKSYNKDTKEQSTRPMKNRSNNNTVLPPQIKSNLPDVNKPIEKQLLKENANRYTWEGRLTNFCPLKKIDRKIVDKNLTMTYADFKKYNKEQQNKK
jgi:hypothetical protein